MSEINWSELWNDRRIVDDFAALCDTGGRLAGSDSEMSARAFLSTALDEFGGTRNDFTSRFSGYQPGAARCEVVGTGRTIDVVTLPGSPPMEPSELEVVDLGVGLEAEFAAASSDLAGKMVLVSHEYPFSLSHTHRWKKYGWACDSKAAAFAIVNNQRAIGPVTGGVWGFDSGIPGVGLSQEDGDLLKQVAASGGKVKLNVESDWQTWDATNLILDLKGRKDRYVLLCAHADGHNLAESAMDNATGLAAVLSIARLMAPLLEKLDYGLRVAFFTVEEWGLTGSREYVQSLSDQQREEIVCAFALDSITGHARLSGLTGGYREMAKLLKSYSDATGVPIDVVTPPVPNSDHASFQEAGIPAVRMMAGFGYPDSLTRYLLTPADRREIVDIGQLKAATAVVAGLVHMACSAAVKV